MSNIQHGLNVQHRTFSLPKNLPGNIFGTEKSAKIRPTEKLTSQLFRESKNLQHLEGGGWVCGWRGCVVGGLTVI